MFRLKRMLGLFLMNHMFVGTRFFQVKRYLARFAGFQVGTNVSIVGPISVGNICKVHIGDNCWLGKDMKIYGNGSVFIANNVDVAPNVSFFTGGHEIGGPQRRASKGLRYEIIIKNGCWIGGSVSLFNNITINEGVVIGLGSVVNKSCNKNCVYAGNPAKVVRRLDPEGFY
ncbi:MAG: acyltransferase [Lactococcus lactis]|nr:acyltransferase [Lactococcus lactis]